MAKINITVSGTTYDGDLDLAGDSGFQSLITELKSLKSALSAKGKPGAASASIDVTRTQKALDSLTDSATNAAKSLDSLEKSASNVSQAFGQSASQAASMGSSMSAVSAASQGLNGSLAQMSNMMSSTGTSLAQMSGMTANAGNSLAQMSGMLGNTGGSLAQMSGMLGKNTKGLTGMASKANLYIMAASLAIEGLAGVVTALSTFTNFLFTGGTKLSDFTEALHKSVSELPIVGGALGLFTGVLATVTKTLDGYLDALEKTSANGASFNNSIMMMRAAAFDAGQTMEEFAGTVSANTEKFALFGTVTEGALKFAKVSNMVRGDLRNLGYSVQEINDTLPTMMVLLSAGAKDRGQSDEELAEASKFLMKEMDAMAKLTGKNRKQVADEQAKAMQDAAIKMKMASMSADQQAAINAAMTQARETLGEGAAEQVKLMLLGIPPQTEAQRAQAAILGDANKEVLAFVKGVKDGTVNVEGIADKSAKGEEVRKKFQEKLDDKVLDAHEKNLKVLKQNETIMAVSTMGGKTAMESILKDGETLTKAQLTREGLLDKEAQKKVREDARAESKNRNAETQSLQDFQSTMEQMKKAMFDNVILPLFEHFKPALTGFADWAKGGVQSLIQAFKDPSSFINATLLPNLKSFGTFIMETAVPALAKLGGFILDIVWPAFKTIAGFLLDNWKPILIGLGIALSPLIAMFLTLTAPIVVLIGLMKILEGNIILLKAGFQKLKETGLTFNIILEMIGDGFKSVFYTLEDSVLSLVEKFGKFLGMDTSWIGEKRKQIAEEQKLLDQKAKDREEQRQKNAEAAKKQAAPTAAPSKAQQPTSATPATPTTAPPKAQQPTSATPAAPTAAPPKAQQPTSATPAAPTAAPSKSEGTLVKPMAMNADQQKNADLLTAELKKKGFNQGQIAAVLGNVAKESGFQTRSENLDYSKTSNERIRSIFGSRATGKTDAELDVIKKDPKQMGEMMYGAGTKVGQGMGNTEPGDGFKYRGRGFIQLTGKNNYAAASKAIFGDNRLVDNPDLASDPAVAAQISAWFTEKQGKGMAKKMGVDLASASQEDLNRVYTSAIAGREIKKGETGYLGGEVMSKVSAYAQQFGGMPTAPSSTPTAPSGGTVVASVTPTPAAVAPLPTPVTAESAQTRTPAKASGDSGILSTLRELVDLQYKANRMLSTISANV